MLRFTLPCRCPIASSTDWVDNCSRSLDSEGAGLDPLTTPVSQCLGDDKWAQKLREVFADDLFTVSELKAYTLDEFVDILAQMGVLVYLAKPIAVRIGNVWPNVFKEGT